MKSYSLHRRALQAFAVPLAVAVAVTAVIAWALVFSTISAIEDTRMQQSAQLLALLAKHEAAERDALDELSDNVQRLPGGMPDARTEFRIWSDSGLVTQSPSMPSIARQTESGFHTVRAGRAWRVYVLNRDNPTASVELAEPSDVRVAMTAEVILALCIPMALLGLAVAGIGSLLVLKALKPVNALSADLDAREAADIRPVAVAELPGEVAPLVEALNSLFARLRDAFEREREFSDNAAHELRTPLAGLKLRAQLVAERMRDNPDLVEDLDRLSEAVDRTAAVIDQLLTFARVSGRAEGVRIDLSELVADVARGQAPMIIARDIDFSADIAPGLAVYGNAGTLRIAIGNLIENAAKFTPAGGKMSVRVTGAHDGVTVSVCDDGPGIAEGEEEHIFQRFWRGDRTGSGSGLGLAIVDKVIRTHGGHVQARRLAPHGLDIGFVLPAAEPK